MVADLNMQRQADARRGQRVKVFLSVVMISAGRSVPIHLLDLSKNGALGHAPEPRAAGEVVWLVSNGTDIAARIAWVRGNRFGLTFTVPLADDKFGSVIAGCQLN